MGDTQSQEQTCEYYRNEYVLVVITTRTRAKLAGVLQQRGLGLGVTVAQLRRAYPALAVRRASVLEALADLEAMGKVAWRRERVRWFAPFDVERALGEDVQRIERDRAVPADERILRAAQISAHFSGPLA